MPWDASMTNLRNVLGGLFPTVPDSRRIVDASGLPSSHIAFDPSAITNWHSILIEAQRRGKVHAIIDAALAEYPESEELKLAQQGELRPVQGPAIGEEIPWQGPADVDPFEKIIGTQSTLVPISYLEVGMLRARSVARIVNADGSRGSGFVTRDNLLITNHHVLGDATAAAGAIVQFNYQQTLTGADAPYEEYHCAPGEGFATSEEDDWTAVRLYGDANAKWGHLELAPANPQVEDRVNIIQHPGGGPKQLAFFHNVIAYVDTTRVQYLTDTLPGSSGSPVFDRDWRLVALHHSGGALREPGTKRTFFRNEGIHVNAVLDGLIEASILTADARRTSA